MVRTEDRGGSARSSSTEHSDTPDVTGLGPGRYRRPCPHCARERERKHDDALSISVQPGGLVLWKCHRCGSAGATRPDGVSAPRRSGRKCPGSIAIPKSSSESGPRHETLSRWGRNLWDRCQPIAGTARAYLEARLCVIPPADGDLRWHPELRHPSGDHTGPALVALVTGAESAEPLSLHRTWIRDDGSKPAVHPPRMLLARHRKVGGVIRLWPDEAVTTHVALAEGIETALTAAHAVSPVWATIDVGNLTTMPLLLGIERLTIIADGDPAGRAAARACAETWASSARVCIVDPGEGLDVNDVAQRHGPDAVRALVEAAASFNERTIERPKPPPRHHELKLQQPAGADEFIRRRRGGEKLPPRIMLNDERAGRPVDGELLIDPSFDPFAYAWPVSGARVYVSAHTLTDDGLERLTTALIRDGASEIVYARGLRLEFVRPCDGHSGLRIPAGSDHGPGVAPGPDTSVPRQAPRS